MTLKDIVWNLTPPIVIKLFHYFVCKPGDSIDYAQEAYDSFVECGKGLKVNGPCIWGAKSMKVGDYCNFNGISVFGGGCHYR